MDPMNNGQPILTQSISRFESIEFLDSQGKERKLCSLIEGLYKKNVHIPNTGLKYYNSGNKVSVFSLDRVLPDLIVKTRPEFSPYSSGQNVFKTIKKEMSQSNPELSTSSKISRFNRENIESLSQSIPECKKSKYRQESLANEFANIEKAIEVCRDHELNRIVIPNTDFCKISTGDGKTYDVLYKNKLDFKQLSDIELEQLDVIECSDEALKELVTFILYFGYSDTYPRNVRPIDNGEKIALFDFGGESKQGWECGLFGFTWKVKVHGLWKFIPKYQRQIIIDLVTDLDFHKKFMPDDVGQKVYNKYMKKKCTAVDSVA